VLEHLKTKTPAIRSFIRRQGRITLGQQFALEQWWDRYGLSYEKPLETVSTFGREAPLIVEIGFGNGQALAEMARANSGNNYIGIEVHRPGIGHLLLNLDNQQTDNVRVYCHDAIEILSEKISDNSLAGLQLFFPDPWPKNRHHKRRIVDSYFIALVSQKLKRGGYLHMATDWQAYAKVMLSVAGENKSLVNESPDSTFCPRPDYRPLTKFERRGIRLGHGVWDLIFRKA
jgi:tRNA (guanine-N7-)-methyltransferase